MSQTNKDLLETLSQEAGPRFSLIKEIKNSPLYHNSNSNIKAQKFLEENLTSKLMGHNAIPGQLILFQYFKPKTEEQLNFWDKYPCVIFFGNFQSKDGLRILGFNIHYYPTKMRFRIMSKIFEIYKPVYTKYFNKPLPKEIDAFDYKYLMDSLRKAKLDFGVREYIPELCGKTWAIPANMWQVAVFTEGVFMKRTREAIIKYWNEWVSNYYKKDKNKKRAEKAAKNSEQRKQSLWSRLKSKFKK